MKQEKGSALITVILVVLVLTMVGIAGLFFMTTEDRISGVDKMQKVALYAAEDGLRYGEAFIEKGKLADMLSYTPSSPDGYYLPPGGGYRAVLLTNLASPPVELGGRNVPNYEGVACTYSVYIRNNSDDPAGPTTDSDKYADLVVVSTITTGTGQVFQKVLEEQYYWGSNAIQPTQYRFGQWGTSSTQYQ